MATYVTFIRAVNVAGHPRVGMEDVRAVFVRSGCANVRSYLQSGNILFECRSRDRARALAAVERRLATLLGEKPHALVRTIGELGGIIARAPFAAARQDPLVKRYVVFLTRRPPRAPAFPVSSERERLEAVGMTAREVFVVSRRKPNGFFGFPNAFVEALVGVPATSRNWSTVTRLPAFARAIRG